MPVGSGGQAKVNILFSVGGVRNAQRALTSVEKSAVNAGRGLNKLSSALLAVGAAASSAALFKGLQVVANFGQEMATVKAVTGATEEQFARLSEEAQRLGSITRYSAQQAAEGMKFLGMAGFNTDQIMQSAEATLRLAQAGAMSLGQAADFSSNILIGFNLEAEEMGRVVDVMAKAATSSNTSVYQLGEAMKFVAPVAAGLGVTLEEATAAISALSDAGLQASLAGTGLRRVLAEMASPGTRLTEILEAFNMTVDDINPKKVGGLAKAFENLAKTGMPAGEAMKVFQQRGGPAWLVFQKSVEKTSKGFGKAESKFRKFVELYEDVTGSAAEMAFIMDDTLMGAIFRLRSALQGVAIVIGEMGLTQFLQDTIDKIALSILDFRNNVDKLKVAAVSFGTAFAVIFGPAMISGLILAGKLVAGLTVAFLGLVGPIGAAGLAISGLLAYLYTFRDTITISKDSTVKLWDVLRVVFSDSLIPWIKSSIASIKEFFSEISSGSSEISIPWYDMGISFLEVLSTMTAGLKAFAAGASVILETVFAKIFIDDMELFKSKFIAAISGDIEKKLSKLPAVGKIASKAIKTILADSMQIDPRTSELITRSWEDTFKAAGEASSAAFIEANFADKSIDALNKALEFVEGGGLKKREDAIKAAEEARKKREEEERKRKQADLAEKRRLEELAAAEQERLFNAQMAQHERNKLMQKGLEIADRELTYLKNDLAARKAITHEEKKQVSIKMLLDKINQQLGEEGKGLIDENTPKIVEFGQALDEGRKLQESFFHGAKKGWYEYSEGLNNVALDMDNLFYNAFQGMEDAFVSFVETGKLSFKGMIDSMIADLTRFLVRQMVMKSIMAPLGNFMGFSNGGGFGGAEGFAKGGIVNGATGFTFGNNKLGVMGEAGPEAIMPLKNEGGRYSLHTASGQKLLITRLSNGIMGVEDSLRNEKVSMFATGGVVGGSSSGITPAPPMPSGSRLRESYGDINYSPVVEINVQGSSGDNAQDTQQAEIIGREVSRALEAEMAKFISKQQRPGNMLKPQRKVF